MATVHMLIGIPGSGKSTYCNNVLIKKYPEAVFIASDKVRDNNPNMSEDQIWPEIYRLCSEALNNNKDIIYDATNITPTVRNRFFAKLAEKNVKDYDKIAYFFVTDPNKCVERVAKRNTMPNERYLPLEVIKGYGEKIIAPIDKEGFKEVIIIDNNKNDDNYHLKTDFNEK